MKLLFISYDRLVVVSLYEFRAFILNAAAMKATNAGEFTLLQLCVSNARFVTPRRLTLLGVNSSQ
jgi:hypothetical protein